jgi:hypothetical protein
MKNNIYKKYCNGIQNPALGAILISVFADTYEKTSLTHNRPSLLMIFMIIPIILNKDFRNCLIKDDGKKASKNALTLISKINEKKETFDALHNYINVFKNYIFTSFIFGLQAGIISLDSDAGIICKSTKLSELPEKNIYVKSAKILGEYFANGISVKFLARKLGVIF